MMEPLHMIILILSCFVLAYSLMMTCYSFFLYRRNNGVRPDKPEPPFVTVIVPVRNEVKGIIKCLESIVKQNYPGDKFEVIVSDDDSDDDTVVKAREFSKADLSSPVRIIQAQHSSIAGQGKKFAVMRAIAEAKGEIVITTDADTNHGRNWLEAMVSEYLKTGARMVLGPVSLEPGPSLLTRMQAVEFMGIMGLTSASANRGHPIMANGANLLFERNAFFEAGGYEGNLRFRSGDDQFLLASFIKTFGGKAIGFAYDQQAIVTTFPEPSLEGFMYQRIRWISKSRGYRDATVIVSGMLAFLATAAIWCSAFLVFWQPDTFWVPLIFFAVKMASDLAMVTAMCLFFNHKGLLKFFVPAQMFQLVYVPLVGLASWLVPYSWKGRRSRA